MACCARGAVCSVAIAVRCQRRRIHAAGGIEAHHREAALHEEDLQTGCRCQYVVMKRRMAASVRPSTICVTSTGSRQRGKDSPSRHRHTPTHIAAETEKGHIQVHADAVREAASAHTQMSAAMAHGRSRHSQHRNNLVRGESTGAAIWWNANSSVSKPFREDAVGTWTPSAVYLGKAAASKVWAGPVRSYAVPWTVNDSECYDAICAASRRGLSGSAPNSRWSERRMRSDHPQGLRQQRAGSHQPQDLQVRKGRFARR